MICNNCNAEILTTVNFCPDCGNSVENLSKTCPNRECKCTGLPPEAVYCPECGVILIDLNTSNESENQLYNEKNTTYSRKLIQEDKDYISGESFLKKKEYQKAYTCLLISARNKNDRAMNQIGNMFQMGLYVNVDINKAIEFYIQAANLGNIESQRSLGILYSSGEFMYENYMEAYKWLKMAALQNDGLSQYAIGLCHEYGNGTYIDLGEAKKWYKLAVENGNDNANERLEKAKFWYI